MFCSINTRSHIGYKLTPHPLNLSTTQDS